MMANTLLGCPTLNAKYATSVFTAVVRNVVQLSTTAKKIRSYVQEEKQDNDHDNDSSGKLSSGLSGTCCLFHRSADCNQSSCTSALPPAHPALYKYLQNGSSASNPTAAICFSCNEVTESFENVGLFAISPCINQSDMRKLSCLVVRYFIKNAVRTRITVLDWSFTS